MLNVKPTETERLRLLLVYINCPQSFCDLKTLSNLVVCDTFHKAAQMKGLLNFEKEWECALTKAAMRQVSAQLRDIFLASWCPAVMLAALLSGTLF